MFAGISLPLYTASGETHHFQHRLIDVVDSNLQTRCVHIMLLLIFVQLLLSCMTHHRFFFFEQLSTRLHLWAILLLFTTPSGELGALGSLRV